METGFGDCFGVMDMGLALRIEEPPLPVDGSTSS